jgi:hypothetical protein
MRSTKRPLGTPTNTPILHRRSAVVAPRRTAEAPAGDPASPSRAPAILERLILHELLKPPAELVVSVLKECGREGESPIVVGFRDGTLSGLHVVNLLTDSYSYTRRLEAGTDGADKADVGAGAESAGGR